MKTYFKLRERVKTGRQYQEKAPGSSYHNNIYYFCSRINFVDLLILIANVPDTTCSPPAESPLRKLFLLPKNRGSKEAKTKQSKPAQLHGLKPSPISLMPVCGCVRIRIEGRCADSESEVQL